MIGYFSTEPLAPWLSQNLHSIALTEDDLLQDKLPKTAILLLPEYYGIEADLSCADLNTTLIGINQVTYPDPALLPPGCFYYNGWPRPNTGQALTLEVAAPAGTLEALRLLAATVELIVAAAPMQAGLLSARVIAMIINEAHLLAAAGHAQPADIDLAMRLGTGYPLGPFAWEQLWGQTKTMALLTAMAEAEPDVVTPYFR